MSALSHTFKSHRICVAPMHGYTDRHYRYFMRLITRHAFLYTEMVVSNALLGDHVDALFKFNPCEHPVALQLLGCDPMQLAQGAKVAEQYGYDEVNLNLGCPSSRVQQAGFGIAFMRQPTLVLEALSAMREATALPVTAKIRLSTDEEFSYDALTEFAANLLKIKCPTLIIHARRTLGKNVSPKKNRRSELDYDAVYRLKKDFPELEVVINGGINDLTAAKEHLQNVDGVMIGTASCRDPYLFSTVDALFYEDEHPIATRAEVGAEYLKYVFTERERGTSTSYLLRHLLNLFRGVPGAQHLRRQIAESVRTQDLEALQTIIKSHIV